MTEEERREQRKKRKLARRRQIRARLTIIFTVVVLIGVLSAYLLAGENIGLSSLLGHGTDPAVVPETELETASETQMVVETENSGTTEVSSEEEDKKEKEAERQQLIDEAALTAAGYDYLGAIEQLKTWEGYEEDEGITALIDEYQADNDAMVPVDMEKITHIFYHSLVVDPDRGFTGSGAAGFKQWMTTVYEFDQITQQMYDNGYVLISLYDMVEETTDADGNVKLLQKQLYLPEGKTPYVLSVDDLSYYHSYDGHGIATKIVLDENGEPTCEYVDADGQTLYGSYDVVPRLNDFLEEHPDGAYHGARGTIALTGYDGIFGYRTDIAYKTLENLDSDQKVWLDEHPDFDYDEECAEAKKVADAIKATGWTIASHTWGHMKVADSSFERLQRDTAKWKAYVEPLVGETDIIIFAHGQDLCGVEDYSTSNEKYAFLKSQGYNIYCNVDSSQYFLQYRDDYLRMGRRNLDGYRLWNDVHGSKNRTSDLFDASTVLDPARTDMPDL